MTTLADIVAQVSTQRPHWGCKLESGRLSLYWGRREIRAYSHREGLHVSLMHDGVVHHDFTTRLEMLPQAAQQFLA